MDDYSAILNPCRDPLKNFDIDISSILQRYLRVLTALNLENRNEDASFNFAEAALLIQNSTCVYGKKVEHLHHLAHELLQNLHNEQQKAQSPGTDAARGRDVLLSGKHSTEFVSLDNIKICGNLTLSEDTQRKAGFQRMAFVPLALLPLDDTEKGKLMLKNIKGEVLGNKKDFQLNLCRKHRTGCLLLPTVNFDLLCDNNPIAATNTDATTNPIENENENVILNHSNEVLEPIDHHLDMPVDSPAESMHCPPSPMSVCGFDVGNSLPAENDPVLEIPHHTDLRRRSMRQAVKARIIEEEKMKKKELQLKVWANTPLEIPEFKKKIQKKKNIKKLPKKLSKTDGPRNKTTTTTITFCSKNFFSNEIVFAKKISSLSVNDAFTDLAYENCKKEQEMLLADNKKLSLTENGKNTEEELLDEQADDFGDAPGDDDTGECDIDNIGACNTDTLSLAALPGSTFPDEFEDLTMAYEDLVQKHVENYMNEVAQHTQTTELSEKVTKWEDRIKPVLERENERESFSVHTYGSRVIGEFQDNNRKQTLSFATLCDGKEAWEISRYFLATLQLANHNNIQISGTINEFGTQDIDLTLLTRKRHHEDLDAFGHSNSEHS